jgi:hypothetical protein
MRLFIIIKLKLLINNLIVQIKKIIFSDDVSCRKGDSNDLPFDSFHFIHIKCTLPHRFNGSSSIPPPPFLRLQSPASPSPPTLTSPRLLLFPR